ncbi:MAG: peptidoglycan DD-metalloendopeptidase family protein [Candidatus Eremiobacterota bacterium]
MRKFVQVAALAGTLAATLFGAAISEERNDKPTSTQVPAVVDKLREDYGVSDPLTPASGDVRGLADLVAIQRRHYPGAVVTSGYYDWRTTSRYRSRAGLHLGYDIAMPYGTPFAAGWGGTVISVANWYGAEYGITVQSPGGFTVTYGHVTPHVSVGQQVMPGDVLGTIAYNHVDVKMRDASGAYVPFGEGADIPSNPLAMLASGTTDSFLVTWLVARNSVELADAELSMRKWERVRLKADQKRLKSRVPELEKMLVQMTDYAERGLVARREVEETRQELARAKKRARTIGPELETNARSLASMERQLAAARSRLQLVESQARSRGLAWKDVEALVNRVVAQNPSLKEQVVDYKRSATEGKTRKLAELRKKVEDGRERLQKLEELYEMGGLPRVELEAAREKQKALENQLNSSL